VNVPLESTNKELAMSKRQAVTLAALSRSEDEMALQTLDHGGV
jgi:hypothetical protein